MAWVGGMLSSPNSPSLCPLGIPGHGLILTDSVQGSHSPGHPTEAQEVNAWLIQVSTMFEKVSSLALRMLLSLVKYIS
jgi:hypothetical protein